jgi:hypothetical protein
MRSLTTAEAESDVAVAANPSLGARFSDDSLALLLLPLPPFAYTH